MTMEDTSKSPTGRLKDALSLENLLLDEGFPGDLAMGSPLHLMSPGPLISAKLTVAAVAPRVADPDRIAAIPPNHQDSCAENDALAPLPSFRKRNPDPRRQSTAIFSAFEATTSGAGLLGDSELAVGDEDQELLIPLAKSSAALASKGVNSLWVDPDTDDALLDEALPEPSLADLEAQARSTAAVATPAGGIGIRDSVALFEGFSLACESSLGLDAVEEEDALFNLSPMAPAAASAAPVAPAATVASEPKVKEAEKTKAVAPPPRKPSRLKPPSSSSSFFTQTTAKASNSASISDAPRPRVPQAPKAQPTRAKALAPARPELKPKAAPVSNPTPAPQPAEKKLAVQPRQLAPSRLPRSRLPAPKPVAAAVPAAVPAPKPKPAHAPVKTQTVVQQRKPQPAAVAPVNVSTPVPPPASASPSAAAADDTPRTAHLRWLEEHPELAFGGGAKIANTPGEEDEPKKKTAEERHYEAWGKAVTPL